MRSTGRERGITHGQAAGVNVGTSHFARWPLRPFGHRPARAIGLLPAWAKEWEPKHPFAPSPMWVEGLAG